MTASHPISVIWLARGNVRFRVMLFVGQATTIGREAAEAASLMRPIPPQ
jgi:hypothetical protein